MTRHHFEWDLVRVVAALLVVLGHVSSAIWYQPGAHWQAANVYDSFARASVPLFFMVSGALLIPKQEAISLYVKKRLARLTVPIVFWSAVYVAWNRVFDETAVAWDGLARVLTEPAYYHLWFLYALLFAYTAVPVLRWSWSRLTDVSQRWLVASWLTAVAGLSWMQPPPFGPLHPINLLGYVGYLLLGAIVQRIPPMPLLGAALYVSAGIFTAMATAWLSRGGTPEANLYGFLMPNVIVMAIGLMMLLRALAGVESCKRASPWIAYGATLTFGIYLVHPIFAAFLDTSFCRSVLLGYSWIGIPAVTIFWFVVSAAAVAAMGRIPGCRFVLGESAVGASRLTAS